MNGAASDRNEGFHRGRVQTPSELFFLGLLALDHRYCQQLLVDPRVKAQNLEHLFVSLFARGMCGVPLLPKELTGAQERRRVLKLPTHHIRPLVELER